MIVEQPLIPTRTGEIEPAENGGHFEYDNYYENIVAKSFHSSERKLCQKLLSTLTSYD